MTGNRVEWRHMLAACAVGLGLVMKVPGYPAAFAAAGGIPQLTGAILLGLPGPAAGRRP